MKILIDINHPAHVHYFRNFIKIMEGKGHKFKITNRDSPMINYLLDYYGIEHVVRNARAKSNGVMGSLKTLLSIVKTVFTQSLNFKPDMYVGFANAPSAIVSKLFGKPCILLDDTEHNGLNHKIYLPCTSCVLTPFYFNKTLGKKQIYFNAFVEQLYLHSNVFKLESEALSENGLTENGYALFRYIAYDAHHDVVAKPVAVKDKIDLLNEAAEQLRPVLSVEEGAKAHYPEQFLGKFKPEMIHNVEGGARFIVSEGGTMATECFLLGTPFIVINPLRSGSCDHETSVYNERALQTTDVDKIKERVRLYLSSVPDKDAHRRKIEESTIDPTKMLVWFVENYPESEKTMRENPDFQNNFK